MTAPRDVVIVGASLAGLRAAEALRDQGYDGRLTLIGDETHAPYDRPPLSKQVLSGWVGPTQTTLPRLRRIDANWRLGEAATGLDRSARLVLIADGSKVSYDRLVIATGSRARPWPVAAEAAAGGVHTLRTPEDAAALLADLEAEPRRVLIVGAGFTGSEVASACRSRGLAVTVVERLSQPMVGAFGTLIGAHVAERQRAGGVDLRCGVTVVQLLIGPAGRVTGARLSDGDTVAADVVVVCLGAVRNVEWLANAGLDATPAGCVCDAHGNVRDSAGVPVPDIFACGDVARCSHPLSDGRLVSLERWGVAVDQARVAAANVVNPGSASNDADMPRFWSASFGMSFKVSGLPACADEVMLVQGSLANDRFVAAFGKAGRLVGIVAVNQARWMTFYEQQIVKGARFPLDFSVVDRPADRTPQPAGFPEPPNDPARSADRAYAPAA